MVKDYAVYVRSEAEAYRRLAQAICRRHFPNRKGSTPGWPYVPFPWDAAGQRICRWHSTLSGILL